MSSACRAFVPGWRGARPHMPGPPPRPSPSPPPPIASNDISDPHDEGFAAVTAGSARLHILHRQVRHTSPRSLLSGLGET